MHFKMSSEDLTETAILFLAALPVFPKRQEPAATTRVVAE
jgi:hypothetical protein